MTHVLIWVQMLMKPDAVLASLLAMADRPLAKFLLVALTKASTLVATWPTLSELSLNALSFSFRVSAFCSQEKMMSPTSSSYFLHFPKAALQALTAVTTAVLFELRSQALISAVAAVTAALGVQQSQAAAPSRAVQVSV